MAKPAQTPFNLNSAVLDALTLHRQGQLAEAEKMYTRVLKARPDLFDALHLLGMVKLQRGKVGDAYQLLLSALKVNPKSPDALSNFGLVLNALKRSDDALASFDKALALDPDHIDALNNRGNALLDRRRAAEALACFEKILAVEPRHLQAQVNRGNALIELGRREEAVAVYDTVLGAHPGDVIAHFNRGNALLGLGRSQEALASFDKVVAAAPEHAAALNNRGLALQALNRHADAAASYAKAIAVQKDYADAHFNLALALLTTGDFRRGFAEYEWRWKRTGMGPQRRNLGAPWSGQNPLARKTILLLAEQGLGDTIQFARYVPVLARTGAKVVLEVQPELKNLLSRIEGVSGVVARGEALPAYDVHCHMGTLPRALGTESGTIPTSIPYLRAAEDRIAKWKARLGNASSRRVAIAWSGSAGHANDRNRSLALVRLLPLMAVENVQWVSIQRDLREGDADLLSREPRIMHLGAELGDFDDTAAVMDLVDLVIAVDTSVAHLAAAMGRPAWLLLPFSADWRWTSDRDASPWYPSVRLFRQPAIGDWDSVVARVQAELTRQPQPTP